MELEQLPTEAELQRYVLEKRKKLIDLADLNMKIKDLEAELAEEDDEEILLQKIRELKHANEKLTKLPEQPKQAKQPTNSNSPTQIQPLQAESPMQQEQAKEPIDPKSSMVSLNSVYLYIMCA